MNEEITITDENGNKQTIDPTENRKSVGDSSNDLLSNQKFDTLFVELFYVKGLKPRTNTIDNLQSFLNARLNKPGGIQIELKEIESPGKAVYTISDVKGLEDSIRTAYNSVRRITVSGIFIDGKYSENTENGTVLGVAYRNTSFVIFEETVQDFSDQPLSPSTTVLESTVLNHELGHLLGLVNAGTTPQSDHQDVEHGRHCTTEDCLMFWAAETGEGLLNMIGGGSISELDSECLADLKANGGK